MTIIIVAISLLIWFVVSALNQINPIAARLSRFDPLGLLPRWTFFAPNPGIYDYHVIYRECGSADLPLGTMPLVEAAKDRIGAWRPLPDLCIGRSRFMLWNPQRRVTKTITDIVAGLTTLRLEYPDLGDGVQFTSYYWLLLQLTQRHARREGQRQFAVVQSHGFPPARTSSIFFISNFHRVSAR